MSILSSPGLSLAYYLFTFFAIEASFLIAFGHWQRSVSLKARRFAIAFGGLGLARIALLLIFTLFANPDETPFELPLAVISMGVLAWTFSPQLSRKPNLANSFLLLNTGVAIAVFVVSTFFIGDFFILLWLGWLIVLGLALLVSQLREFAPDQTFTAIGIVVLVAGAVFQLVAQTFQFSESSVAVFIRLSEMIAYPILVVAVYQEVMESLDMQTQALENLSETSREQIDGLISLFESTKEIVASLDLAKVLDSAAKGVVNALNVDQCAIALPEESDPTLMRMVATFNPHRAGRGEAITFPLSEQQAIRHAMERMRQVDINIYDSDSPQIKFLFAMMGAVDRTGPLVLHPLILNGEAAGVLIVGNAYSRRALSKTESRLVETMANQIAIAIGNARTYQDAVKKSQQLAWTLRNNEQEGRRHKAAQEAELKKSREEVSLISQRLYEQETLARKSQKELTEYQQQLSVLTRQLKLAEGKFKQLTSENEQLSGLTESQKQHLAELRQTQDELDDLRGQVKALEVEAAQVEDLQKSLTISQERGRKLSRALQSNRSKLKKLTVAAAIPALPSEGELETLSCGVLISDQSGEVNRVNAATANLFGVDGASLLGKNLTDVVDDENWHRAVKRITTDKETFVSANLKLGDAVIKATISPITDPDTGQTSGSVVILYDATEESETRQARDEFVASLAQELRTPMTSIIGYVDLLLGESVGMIGDMQRKFLQRVKANIERMDTLLNDLIGIAAIDAGQLEINPIPLDMGEVIEEAIIGAKAQLEEKEIQLELSLPGDMPAVEADPTCMQQVMLNLLGNATKSTPSNGTVEVNAIVTNGKDPGAAPASDTDERWLRVSVADNGGGISEKDIGRVFDRFYKADAPLIQGLGETGVGLSIVKHLIEAHKGEVWFDTEMGKGTTFHFALPVSDHFDDPWQEIDVPPLDLNTDF